MPNRVTLLVLPAALVAAALAVAVPALAQTDAAAMARASAANQLGILEFCQSRGDVGEDAISAQRETMSRLPPSTASTEAAEAVGKQGAFAAPNGERVTLADMAARQNVNVPALCKQLGNSTLQMAATFKQNGVGGGGLPTMPAMPGSLTAVPGMPTIPAMPGGMPAMPGVMPAMPSASGMTAVPGMPPMPAAPGR